MKVEPRASTGVAASTATRRSVDAVPRQKPQTQAELATEVTKVLAGMTFEERVRAYRSGAFSAHELAVAAARCPKEVPILNDEYEWIAINAE
jgi:hypothetical protein